MSVNVCHCSDSHFLHFHMDNKNYTCECDNIFGGHSCMARDLQEQISRARGDHRLGLRLPRDHKFSGTVDIPAAVVAQNSQHETMKGRDGPSQPSSVEKANERKDTEA